MENIIKPKIIILFGSCARGLITSYSDIDLCIVMEQNIEPKEWERNHKNQGTFIGKIYKEGKVLYGR